MNAGSTTATAWLRGFYVAIVAGLGAALPIFATTDEWKPIVVGFGGAFLGALGVRAALEGKVDSDRQKAGEVKASDVQPVGSGNA
jgi:hypothetical protein